MEDVIRIELGVMLDGAFEKLIRRILPRFHNIYQHIEPTYNFKGKVTKGPVDLYCHKIASDTYSAIICTTQSKDVKSKIREDINKLNAEECYIRNKIDEVIICVNTCIKSEAEIYRELCRRYNWQCILFSLERLTCLVNENPDIADDICYKHLSQARARIMKEGEMHNNSIVANSCEQKGFIEKHYSCGARVKAIRADIRLSSSRFVDLIEFNSERYLVAVENDGFEVSESEILNISEKTGVSYRWLKHGEGRKYESETIATSDSGKIEKIKNASPKSLYFLLNESDMSILLIVHVESYNWRLFTFTFGLDFWDWFGDQHYIPEIFELLKCFRDEFGYTLQGRIIDSGLYERAISGNEHLSLIIEDTRGKGQHWFDDLLNINSSYFNQEYYSNLYGHWFAKIQRYFK